MNANGSPLESAIARVGFRGTMSASELLEEVNERLVPTLGERHRATVKMLLDDLTEANDAFSNAVLAWGRLRDQGSSVGADYVKPAIRRQHEALCDFLTVCAVAADDTDSLERVTNLRADEDTYVAEMVNALHSAIANADSAENASGTVH